MPSNEFAVMLLILKMVIDQLGNTGLCGKIGHGTLTLQFRIADGKIVHAAPSVELSVKP